MRGLLPLALIALPAAAGPPRPLARVTLGGLHIGMTAPEVEALIQSRHDVSEVMAQSTPVDGCGDRQAPTQYSFTDARNATDTVSFPEFIGGAGADHIVHREYRLNSSWPAVLDEARARFGPPTATAPGRDGPTIAAWCRIDSSDCATEDLSKPKLLVTWRPHEPGQIEPGDAVDWEVSDPDRALPRRRGCGIGPDLFASPRAFQRHLTTLTPGFPGASRLVEQWQRVPRTVFSAAGVDANASFGDGACFDAMDFTVEGETGCRRLSAVAFRWARQHGATWLLALAHGGNSLRRSYLAVEQRGDGYRARWCSDTLAGFAGWWAGPDHERATAIDPSRC